MENRTLDWVAEFDPKSKEYPIRTLLSQRNVEDRFIMWGEGVVTDQGAEGACVGFAWMNELLAAPLPPVEEPTSDTANGIARSYYQEAKKIDQWHGEDYEGTSVLAGAKVIKSKGYIEEYRWCYNVEDIKGAIISEGPVVLGIPWYEGMYRTTQDALVSVSGKKVGGHAILVTGYNPHMVFGSETLEVFRWRNSWGSGYGHNGSGWIKSKDLQMLMKEGGEACVPMQRTRPIFEKI